MPKLSGEILLIVGRNDTAEIARMAAKAEAAGGIASCDSQGAFRKLTARYPQPLPETVRLGGATIDCCVPISARDCLMLGVSRVVVDSRLVRFDNHDWGIDRRLWERRGRLKNNLWDELSNPRLIFEPTMAGTIILYLAHYLRRQHPREF